MRHFFLGGFTAILVFVFGGILYLRLGWAEVRGDIAPLGLESSLMEMAVHASVRRHAPEIPNPVAPTNENLIAGGKMYLNECAGCHGTPGRAFKGINPLNPPAPQLSEVGTAYSEAQIFWVAKHGIRRTGMFANGMWDSDQKLWTVAAFIYRIKRLPPQVGSEVEKAAQDTH